MAKAPPAFQFYPNDFVSGTRRMTTAEVGAYILLLCAQWDDGSVPGDDLVALAQTMRCTPSAAKKIWPRIQDKFIRDEQGGWRNTRLELVRQEQDAFRQLQAQKGAKGAKQRWQTDGRGHGPGIAEGMAEGMADACPKGWPEDGSPISEEEIPKEVPPPPISTLSGVRPAPLVVGPLRFLQKAEKFAWYGSRLRVPHVLHDELRTKLGGTDTDARLCHWYDQVNTECDVGGTPIVDVFVFLRPKFVEWASDAAADAELEKYRPKEAPWTGRPGSGSTSACAPRMARLSTVSSARPTTKA